MRKFKFLSMAAIAAMMLGACSDDKLSDGPDSPNGPGTETQDGVYFTINIDLPNAKSSRSQTEEPGENGSTSNDGVEIGKERENIVESAIIVLAEADETVNKGKNNFIAAAMVNKDGLNPGENNTKYVVKSKFTKTQLSAFYSSIKTAEDADPTKAAPLKANIFVFCNPTQQLIDKIFGTEGTEGTKGTDGAKVGSNEWVNYVADIDAKKGENIIWNDNAFLMTNALIAEREIPGSLILWNYYTSQDNPFKLSENNSQVGINNGNSNSRGNIKVERASARFDFRDASPLGKFEYNVIYLDADKKEIPLVNVVLGKMALVNFNKKFYFLPHTVGAATNDGQTAVIDTESILNGICQPEEKWSYNNLGGVMSPYGNYVLDAEWEWKNDTYNAFKEGVTPPPTYPYSFDEHFCYPFFNNDGTIDNTETDRWLTSLCEDVVAASKEDDNKWTTEGSTDKGYKIWKYAPENTIPSVNGQINSLSTGVVFKAKMKATSDALTSTDEDTRALANKINNTDKSLGDSYADDILYAFGGRIFRTWENVRKAAIEAAAPKITWTIDDEKTGAGHWELSEINRTNSLYKAVFGNDGGCGDFKFTYVEKDANGNVITDEKGDPIKHEGVIADTKPTLANTANAAWTAWANDGKKPEGALKEAFKAAVTKAEFTIYQSSYDEELGGWGYYCYYYYWNRHNDNLNNGVMGPMEFAVVRNNVYKLAVTKISRLGHPRISENDPDKPTPGTPDEKEDVYLTVTAEVLPWVVRVNNIEF